MIDARRILFLLGYFLFFGPPRALDLQRNENAKEGELSGLPILLVVLAEALIRGGTLLLFAVSLELLLGSYWYSHFRFDLIMGVVILVGSGHIISYYLIFVMLANKLGDSACRIYRYARNFFYAFLPGLAVITSILLWHAFNPLLELSDQTLVTAYEVCTILLLIIGTIEASLVKRKPLGLDKAILNHSIE